MTTFFVNGTQFPLSLYFFIQLVTVVRCYIVLEMVAVLMSRFAICIFRFIFLTSSEMLL